MTYQVTNEQTFNKVVDVEITLSKNSGMLNGIVSVEVEGEGWRDYQGQHGAHDFEEDYGFIIIE